MALDGSDAMLREARGARRGSALGAAVRAVHGGGMAVSLPEEEFDAVVSALAIHHLDDADKRRLFGRALERLRPGGVFVNAEQVAAPSPRPPCNEGVWSGSAVRLARPSQSSTRRGSE